MLLQRATLPVLGLLFAFLISEAREAKAAKNNLNMFKEWKALDFLYPTKKDRDEAIKRKEFIPGQLYPFDIAVYYNRKPTVPRIILTIPRAQDGVPLTLGYMTRQRSSDGNPLIAPYPDWESQKPNNCDKLISVWRIQIDRCGRLWVVDSGKIKGLQMCPPRLQSFSLRRHKLLSSYRFKEEDYNENSLFVNAVVDVSDENCKDTFVYVADAEGYGLVVYDHKNMLSWRIENKLFRPYAEAKTFSVGGYTFDMMRGISGMALSPPTPHGNKVLYFNSLSSFVESYVFTPDIKNRTFFLNNRGATPPSLTSFKHKRRSQSAAGAMDASGVLFFGLMTDTEIACWNSQQNDYDQNNFATIAVDPTTLQYASGVTVVPKNEGREELWVLTTSYQRYVAGKLSPKTINFRIQVRMIDELIAGTICEPVHADK